MAACLVLMYSAPSPDPDVEDITSLMICAVSWTAPLLGGMWCCLTRRSAPQTQLHALGSLKYDASLCTLNTISLTWYVTMASLFVAA